MASVSNVSERGFSIHETDVPVEGLDEAGSGVAWWTMVSGDRLPSAQLTAGVCEIAPASAGLQVHRHPPAEVYHFLTGTAIVTIGEVEHPAGPGTTIYIPGGEWHAIRPVGRQPVRLFYCFPTDSFSDVIYEYRTP